jgi:hypothetical protein
VVNLVGPDVVYKIDQISGIGYIAVMEIQAILRPIMRVPIDMIDALRVESTGTPDQAMNLIALR